MNAPIATETAIGGSLEPPRSQFHRHRTGCRTLRDGSRKNQAGGATGSATGKHAMVQREGYSVPLIGIPPDAVLEECDCCHELLGLSKLTWTGKQMLCAKCAEEQRIAEPSNVPLMWRNLRT